MDCELAWLATDSAGRYCERSTKTWVSKPTSGWHKFALDMKTSLVVTMHTTPLYLYKWQLKQQQRITKSITVTTIQISFRTQWSTRLLPATRTRVGERPRSEGWNSWHSKLRQCLAYRVVPQMADNLTLCCALAVKPITLPFVQK